VGLGVRLEVSGLENVPASGPFILVANHQSVLDPILVQSVCPRHLHTFTKSTQFSSRLFRWVLVRVNGIPTRRYRVDPQVVRVALRRLEAGAGVGIYPEGERSWDGTLQPFRQGTVRFLLKAGVPIVPCGLDGSYDVWPRWSRRLRRRRVRLRFGKPLHWATLGTRPERDAALPQAAEALKEALLAMGAWNGGVGEVP
jgi:1-acyl-sn-glycerol-3-phosphate acyltransferase